MSTRKISLFLLGGAWLAALSAWAEPVARDPGLDWPQFRGAARDGHSAAKGLAHSWPEGGPKVLWKKAIGAGFAGVAVVGDRAYTAEAQGEKEYALCLEAKTGKELWRTEIGKRFVEEFGDGPRATPTVDGDRVYVLGSYGHLHALATADGSKQWSVDLPAQFGSEVPRWGYAPAPLVDGDQLLLEVGGKEAGKALAAFDKKTGAVRWTLGDGAASYSSPIAVTIDGVHQIIFLRRGGNELISVLPKGEVYWRHTGPPGSIALPVFLPPNRIYASSADDAGAMLVEVTTVEGKPQVKEVWRSRFMKNHFNAAVQVGDSFYGFDNASFKSLSAATGEQNWVTRGFGKGSLVAADGLLFMLSDQGLVVLVEANSKAFVEKGRIQAMTGRAWTSPSLAEGRLFLRDQDEIVCLDVRAQ